MAWVDSQNVFENRRTAGRALAEQLMGRAGADALILALPRGGVPVAYEVALTLGAELDVLIVRKIGAPGHEELGLGAVVDGANPHVVMNERVMAAVRPPQSHVEAETERQIREIDRRRRAYRGDRPPADAHGRTVVVVDDGIATGGTARAALEAIRAQGPKRLILATPVAPPDTLDTLGRVANDVVCLSAPEPFLAVGAHYRDFRQTEDAEVVALLAEAASRRPAAEEP